MAPSHTFTLTTSHETPVGGSQTTVYKYRELQHISMINEQFT